MRLLLQSYHLLYHRASIIGILVAYRYFVCLCVLLCVTVCYCVLLCVTVFFYVSRQATRRSPYIGPIKTTYPATNRAAEC